MGNQGNAADPEGTGDLIVKLLAGQADNSYYEQACIGACMEREFLIRPWNGAGQRFRAAQNFSDIVAIGYLYGYATVGGDGFGAGDDGKIVFRVRLNGNELKD